MKVFIYAYEDQCSGLHGVYDQAVVEVADIREADEIACEMSEGVIGSYSYLFDDDGDEDEFEEENGTEWIIYKIRDDVNLSVEELDVICSNYDYESFVEEYCDKETLN